MRRLFFGFGSLASVLIACSGASVSDIPNAADTDAGTSSTNTKDGSASSSSNGDDDNDSGQPVLAGGSDASSASKDSGSGGDDDDDTTADSGSSGTVDSGSGTGTTDGGSDGTVTRNKCTNTYGKALTGSFGRLDGYVVAIVGPSSGSSCNEDTTHIHIQVSMNNAIYDVAVNVDGGYWLQKDIGLPSGAWSEGWHTDGFDYANAGIHSTDFTTIAQSALVTALEGLLASANHITAYGTTYTGSDTGSGIHDIHYESTNKDGALFLDPTTSTPHGIFFHFSGDSF